VPAYDAPLFNLGKLAYVERQHHTAQQHWTAYLQLDPGSHWATAIRQTLALPVPAARTPPSREAALEHLLGVSPGTFLDQLPSAWGEPKSRILRVGDERLHVAVYTNHLAVMAEGDEIRLLATLEGFRGQSVRAIVLGSPEAEVQAQYGPPARIVSTPLRKS
jgi:hypothetical protein